MFQLAREKTFGRYGTSSNREDKREYSRRPALAQLHVVEAARNRKARARASSMTSSSTGLDGSINLSRSSRRSSVRYRFGLSRSVSNRSSSPSLIVSLTS